MAHGLQEIGNILLEEVKKFQQQPVNENQMEFDFVKDLKPVAEPFFDPDTVDDYTADKTPGLLYFQEA